MQTLTTLSSFDASTFEIVNGKINLTRIAQSQNKDIKEWFKNKSTTAYLKALQEARGNSPQVEIINGVGSFGTREVALKVAQWISPKFEVFCIEKLDELFRTGSATLQIQLPQTLSEALRFAADLAEQNEQLKINYRLALPKAQFHDEVATSINSITVLEFAKVLNTGRTKLFTWLRDNKYIINSQLPYQEYIDRGYFKVIEKTRKSKTTDETITYLQLLITGKGQTFLAKKFKNIE